MEAPCPPKISILMAWVPSARRSTGRSYCRLCLIIAVEFKVAVYCLAGCLFLISLLPFHCGIAIMPDSVTLPPSAFV